MKKVIFTFIIIFFLQDVFSQKFEEEAIQLREIKISKNEKKLKTCKVGKKPAVITGSYLQNSQAFFLIENIPYGEIKNLTFLFECIVKNHNPVSKINLTQYELNFYDISAESGVGDKINENPILITVEESRKRTVKKTITLKDTTLKTNRFFIELKMVSQLPCDACGFYAPVLFKSDKKLYFYGDVNYFRADKDSQEEVQKSSNYGLYLRLQTLTREY